MIRVFIGYDPREHAAYDVCAHSLARHSSEPVHVTKLARGPLEQQGWFWRKHMLTNGQRIDLQDQKPFSTDFSFTRFLVPALQDYQGWALFLDCDFLINGDIAKLFAEHCDPNIAAYCVKHHHEPPEGLKMDGQAQQRYRRKNWSSLVLWNCGHPSNARLTVENVNARPGSWLHAFSWLDDHEIGALPADWNFLVGWDPMPNWEGHPRGIHYTEGGPWFQHCQDVQYADLWKKEAEHREFFLGKKPMPRDAMLRRYAA